MEKIPADEIRKMYEDGEPTEYIAEHLGYNTQQVSRYLGFMGIKVVRLKNRMRPCHQDEIRMRVPTGESSLSISKDLPYSAVTVQNFVLAEGLRPKKEVGIIEPTATAKTWSDVAQKNPLSMWR